jgi:excisionase family DNA binding protein
MATEAHHPELTTGLLDSERSGRADDLQELLTVEEVAALLKVGKSWVYEHTRSRGVPRSERLPHVKVGKYVRFDARLVRDFLIKRSRIG